MIAVEQHYTDFSVKLSVCTDEIDANQLLDERLEHRILVSKQTLARLRRLWEEAKAKQAATPLVSRDRRQS